MANIEIDFSAIVGEIKPMNAVNNGPVRARSDQSRGNFESYAAAKIPFARTHDANHCASYGAPHIVDIPAIFPDFNADPARPESYDFTLTDEYLKTIVEAGTEVFYRLGSKIEHWIKKYDTLPPPDFKKWAVICEHVIRHYNEGWANGFKWNIKYWEIWNEPDLDADDSPNKRCWGGDEKGFHDFYRIAATHLKNAFPDLKIGGPASCGNNEWTSRFITAMAGDENHPRTPLDFFSWHIYPRRPHQMRDKALLVRDQLDKNGYKNTESILNEWNYVRGWGEDWIYSIETMIGLKGAVFAAACMCVAQESPIDMLMYYDARVSTVMNGLFDIYTLRPRKTYFAFTAFAKLRELGHEIASSSDDPDIFALSAKNDRGEWAAMICFYTDNDDQTAHKKVKINIKNAMFDAVRCRILDNENNLTEIDLPTEGDSATMLLRPNTMVLLSR